MKHIGIVASSAPGTALCFNLICSEASKILGSHKYPEISIHSFSFHKILELLETKNWEEIANIKLQSIEKIAKTGAQFAIIPANSIHYAIDLIQKKSSIPVLSIVDVTVNECVKRNYKKVLILGIGITMSGGLYQNALIKSNISSITPNENEQVKLNDIILNEVLNGVINEQAVQFLIELVTKYKADGCEAAVLGCTEIPLILTDSNSPLPILDTTKILAKAAVAYSLKQ